MLAKELNRSKLSHVKLNEILFVRLSLMNAKFEHEHASGYVSKPILNHLNLEHCMNTDLNYLILNMQ